MKVDFDQKLRFLNGQDLKIKNGDEEVILTLKVACIEALLQNHPDDQESRAPGKAMAAYNLAMVVNKGGVQEVTSEDISMLKAKVEKHFAPLIIGQVWDLLEGKPSRIEPAEPEVSEAPPAEEVEAQ